MAFVCVLEPTYGDSLATPWRNSRLHKWGSRGLLLAWAITVGCADRQAQDDSPRQNLILISIDTLRADRLGAYGYDRDTSPALDALATRGIRFETVIAESSWTLPSHITLFTGLSPSLHGVVSQERKLADSVPWLTEVLRDQGFRTFAFTGGIYVAPNFGFERGFETYASAMHKPDSEEMQPIAFRTALAHTEQRIAELDSSERFFAFVHTYDVHCPYDPPAEYAERFDSRPVSDHIETRDSCGNPTFNEMDLDEGQAKFLSDRYDAGIRHADDQLGRFLARMEKRGVLDKTVVVVVSDHGEEFLEHGWIGHRTLHMDVLRVPWIVAGPGIEARVVAEPVGLEDVMPTLLALLDVPSPPTEGKSMLPVIRGERPEIADRARFSELGVGPELRSVVLGGQHFIEDPNHRMLFDWRADPKEQTDLVTIETDRAAEMRQLLVDNAMLRSRSPLKTKARILEGIDDELQQQLRALGYAP